MSDDEGSAFDCFSPANILNVIERDLWDMLKDRAELPVVLEDGFREYVEYAYVPVDDIDMLGSLVLSELREALRKAGLDVPLHGKWKEKAEEWQAGAGEREAAKALADAEKAKAAERRARALAYAKIPPTPPVSPPQPEPERTEGTRETALYRWWDENDVLLYVGVSDHLGNRTYGHAMNSSWMDFAVRSAIGRYPDRDAALNAEEAAIKAERPLFNHVHNDTPEARQRLVEYLIKRERLDLLAPAVSRG